MKTHTSAQPRLGHDGSTGRMGLRAVTGLFLGTMFLVQASAQTYLDGLQAHWKLDETTGLTAADSVGTNDGTLTNFSGDDSYWVDGALGGGALEFNGSNYFIVPDAPAIGSELVNSFTVATWFNSNVPLATSGSNRMFEKGNSIFILQGVATGGMNLLVKRNGQNVTAGIGIPLEANRWYHFTGTFDGNEIKVFIDGELRGSATVGGPIDDPGLDLYVGADDAGSFFNGTMDEVMIWNRALDEGEILNVLGRNLPDPPSILVQPASTEHYEGASIAFSVVARGQEPLRYSWFKDDEEIRGTTEPTLLLNDLTPEDAGAYKVKVTNDLGEIFSDTATLTVIPVEDISTAMVAEWKMDETTGLVAADTSGNGNDGTLTDFYYDPDQWVPGQVNNALQFTGNPERVVVNDAPSLDLGPEASFAFWINPATFGDVVDAGAYTYEISRVLSKGGQYDIYITDNPGGLRRTLYANFVPAPEYVLEADTWQHVAVVFKNYQVYFYVNGFPVGNPRAASMGPANDDLLVLGNTNNSVETLRFFNGMMDEVQIWNRPLMESEILELAGKDIAGAPVFELQPVEPLPQLEGGTVTFEVKVTGARPVSYQWYQDGVAIEGATERILTLSQLTGVNSGVYTVTATNGVGSTTSDAVTLAVEVIENVTTGLIAYWNFDETSGTTLQDRSGNGHNGTLQNFTADSGVPGQIGRAFDFDGVDDFVVVPHNSDLVLGERGTISAWVHPRTYSVSGNLGRIVRKGTTFDFSISDNEARNTIMIYGQEKTAYYAPNNSVDLSLWQHVAVVVRDGTIQFFKNGRTLGEPLVGKLGAPSTDDLIIANFGPDMSILRLFNGMMDDLGIWRRALSLNELNEIYLKGLLGIPLDGAFEPFAVHDIDLPAAGQVALTYYTPFPDLEYTVLFKTDLAEAEWTEAADVAIQDIGDGFFTATFPFAGEADAAFFQMVSVPPPPLFFDDFETGASGWTHGGDYDSWELGTPTAGPTAAVSGTNVYGTNLDGNFPEFTNDYLRTPTIDLTDAVKATLSFSHWLACDTDQYFHRAVVSALDPADMSEIIELGVYSGQTAGWQEMRIPLGSEVLGRNIILQFRLTTDDFNLAEGWYIDDVLVAPN